MHRLDADYQMVRNMRDKEDRDAYLQQLKLKRLPQERDDLVARNGWDVYALGIICSFRLFFVCLRSISHDLIQPKYMYDSDIYCM